MAEYLTITQVRNYPLSTGQTVDLAALVSTHLPKSWVGAGPADVKVGDVAFVRALGDTRRGVVVKITKTKVHVAFTTQSSVDGSTGYVDQVSVRVQVTVGEAVWVAPAPAAEPVEETSVVVEAPKVLDATSPLAQSLVEADHAEAIRMVRMMNDATQEEAEEYLDAFPLAQRLVEADHAEALDAISPLAQSLVEADHAEALVIDPDASVDPEDNYGQDDELTLHSQAGKVDTMHNEGTINAKPTAPDQLNEQLMGREIRTEDHTGSTVVALLEKVWTRIREGHPELPEVVIVTGSGEGAKWGHFRPESWKLQPEEGAAVTDAGPGRRHELFLASEALAKGGAQVLQTMLHEAAHTLSRVRDVKDTSRQGRWHNAQFRKAAEEMGLEHKASTADKTHGFSFVTVTPATKDRYADLLADLELEIKLTGLLPVWLGGTGDEDDRGGERITKPKDEDDEPKTKSTKTTCTCDEPNIIRMSKKVLEMRVVRCDECGSLFADRG